MCLSWALPPAWFLHVLAMGTPPFGPVQGREEATWPLSLAHPGALGPGVQRAPFPQNPHPARPRWLGALS